MLFSVKFICLFECFLKFVEKKCVVKFVIILLHAILPHEGKIIYIYIYIGCFRTVTFSKKLTMRLGCVRAVESCWQPATIQANSWRLPDLCSVPTIVSWPTCQHCSSEKHKKLLVTHSKQLIVTLINCVQLVVLLLYYSVISLIYAVCCLLTIHVRCINN